eukprot:EG_transcript_598
MAATVMGRVRIMKRGFGFIDGDNGMPYYYTAGQLKDPGIVVGSYVTFTPKTNQKGPVAAGVKLVQEAPRRHNSGQEGEVRVKEEEGEGNSGVLKVAPRRASQDFTVHSKLHQLINQQAKNWNFSGDGIGTAGAHAVAAALSMSSGVQCVDLSGNAIGAVGAEAMAGVLKANTTVLQLSLAGNNVRANGAQELASALRVNGTLRCIDLSGNNLGVLGARLVMDALRSNSTVQRLGLGRNCIVEDGVREVMDALKTNQNLLFLDVSGNGFGAVGAVFLSYALKLNSSLQGIDLSGNGVKDDGALAFAEILRVNTTLQHIDLSANGIGFRGGAAIAEALKLNSTLWDMDLSENAVPVVDMNTVDGLLLRNIGFQGRKPAASQPQATSTTPIAHQQQPPASLPTAARPPGSLPAAESLLGLHRLLRRVVDLRRRTITGLTAETTDASLALLPPCFRGLLERLRGAPLVAEGDCEVALAQQRRRAAEAATELAGHQRAVREAAATLPASLSDDAVEAALQRRAADRDCCRQAVWGTLQECSAAVLHSLCTTPATLPDSLMVTARVTELQQWVQDVEAMLTACAQAVNEEGSKLGWKSSAPEDGESVDPVAVLAAYETWRAGGSFCALAEASDRALADVTAAAALSLPALLSPLADDTEDAAQRLAVLEVQAAAALRAELAARAQWDPVAAFPAALLMAGARHWVARCQALAHHLGEVLQQLAQWQGQSAVLQGAMDDVAKKGDVLQRLRAAKGQGRVAQLQAKALDVQWELAQVMGTQGAELRGQREAAHRAVTEAKASLQAAVTELVQMAADFPELAGYVERGLPEPLLPLWARDRRLSDFEDLEPIPGPSRNRVYRGRLDGKPFVVKGFPLLQASTAHTCLREATRLVRAAHPHVVEVVALFQDVANHTFYLQMPEYTEGPLDRWAAQHQPDTPAMRRALLQAFDGVAHLHCLGIIHSDLKPSNLLVSANGTVRVGDLDVSVDLATRVSTRHVQATRVGYTVGYAAPELLRTGATAATDAFSLGMVVREMGGLVASCAGPEADNLVARLCADDPAARPTVAHALQHAFFHPALAWHSAERKACCVFASELCGYGERQVPAEKGVACAGAAGGALHFVCDECLEGHVRAFLDSDLRLLRAAEGRVGCPQCPVDAGAAGRVAFPDQQLAAHLPGDVSGAYVGLRLRLTEQQLAEQFDRDLRSAVEAERRLLLEMDERRQRVRQARQHVVERILNLHCPRCGQVFVDFKDCCALRCSRCPCHFCAWCGQDCGADAHTHVARCRLKPPGAEGVFAPREVWEDQQRQRRQRLVASHLNTLDPETREAVRQELRRDFADLRLVV